MCGLTVEQFDLLWDYIKPFVHLINYIDDADSPIIEAKDELLIISAFFRHGFNLGIGGWVGGISESSMQCYFTAWTMFLAALFSSIDLRPGPGFLQSLMPEIFKETGHDLTDQLGDCTKFKLPHASTHDLNLQPRTRAPYDFPPCAFNSC